MASAVVSDNFETSTGAIPSLGGADVTTRLCSAWVNLNGTGTVAIRASYNVSSITDNSTGDYTVNFTTAMPDANYSVANSVGSGAVVTTTPATARQLINAAASYRYASIYASGSSSAVYDYAWQMLSFFR